ncbi:glycosyltransferase [Ferruginibacter albus]|uniref:glycosyltransferase n=1 Tax=Ferruginibacter albus TaxID=2875540 RepID=UPI001CC72B90|nr:glycosyltransferase [Ferruginibacter albus]UAY52322.1 glycosyltransferase [Ferruginibacter albus]
MAKKAFINECFTRIATKHSAHQFMFVADEEFDTNSLPKNCSSLIIGKPGNNNLLWQLWYNYKLTIKVRKIKASVLINTNGLCSLRSKTPQLLLVNDLAFLHYPKLLQKKVAAFYKKFAAPSYIKANNIVGISQSITKTLLEKYKVDESKMSIVSFGLNDLYQSIDFNERESIKEKYAEGKEYFLYAGSLSSIHNLFTLLKAFSFFKKRQKSNMQLLIAATNSNNEFDELLKTYKYRNDVKVLPAIAENELAKIIAAAYTYITVSLYNDFDMYLAAALKCNVPVIASDIEAFGETCDGAALYVDNSNHEDIADKMMLLFKDENKRNELIEKSRHQWQQFNWDKSAELLWQAILETV